MAASTSVDPRRYTAVWPVRQYELDQFGHVNNAVYLNWIEQIAVDHVEALGFGQAWAQSLGGGWVVREHHITYRRPVVYGDTVAVTTIPLELHGVRGVRRTEIRRDTDATMMAEATSEWVWVRISDGRPARIPIELVSLIGLS